MNIPIGSNLVGGAYTCLELIITVIIARLITFVLEAWNVHRVYDEKGELHLRASRLNLLTNYGLSSRTMSLLSAFIFTSVIILSVVGGFAIVGVSHVDVEPVTVKNLVTEAPPGKHNDYSKHISHEPFLYSGTIFLLFQHVGCRRLSSPGAPVIYEYANDLADLTTPIFRPETANLNQTCITSGSGYRQRIALQEQVNMVQERDMIKNCSWTVALDDIPVTETTRVAVQQQSECQFPVREAWCFKTESVFCAGEATAPDGYGMSTFVSDPPSGQPQSSILLLGTRPATGNLKSVAVLLSLRADVSPQSLWWMSLLTVERDAVVEKVVGVRSATEVDEVLLFATLGPAIFIMVLTGIVGLIAWVNVILLPKRRSFNRFTCSRDILALGLSAAQEDAEQGLRTEEDLMLGIRGMEPRVGTRDEMLGIGGAWLREEGTVGRESFAHFSDHSEDFEYE